MGDCIWLPSQLLANCKGRPRLCCLALDGSRLPGIDDCNAEAFVIVDITRDQGKIVFEGGGRDQAVGRIERPALQVPLAVEKAPPLGDRLGYGQNPFFKPSFEVLGKPILESLPTAGGAKDSQPFANFAQGDDADVERRPAAE